MSGDIAVAKAFHQAGNTKRALEYIEKVLQERPEAPEALEILCDILLVKKEFLKVEKIAVDWLGRSPGDPRPYVKLLDVYLARRDKKRARALIDDLKCHFPGETEFIEFFESAYSARIERASTGWDRLAKFYGKRGNKKAEYKANSNAALTRRNLSEAIVEAEYARRVGDNSAESLSNLAILCFHALRLKKSRHYARMALEQDRSLAAPREILVLSWLVLFPPFFIGHIAFRLLQIESIFKRLTLIFLFFILSVFIFSDLVNGLMSIVFLDGWPTAILIVGYALYLSYIGTISHIFNRNRQREITLKDY